MSSTMRTSFEDTIMSIKKAKTSFPRPLPATAITTSKEPWSTRPNGEILDAYGRIIGAFLDCRDADRVVEVINVHEGEMLSTIGG